MKSKMQMWNVISLLGVMLFYLSGIACAEEGILIPGGAGGATVSLPEKKKWLITLLPIRLLCRFRVALFID